MDDALQEAMATGELGSEATQALLASEEEEEDNEDVQEDRKLKTPSPV